ncbi:hypothetical protein QAD02_022195 [Eretmocerus hayati]|uniref:Uncharacterized protein n=1 Tax=Eretmocerus hayati TaxID=131215 RepID=A0ACC2PTX8_9HYME|nr:hypothetical protein QAD02_022195 [Eretmocerus hayati]
MSTVSAMSSSSLEVESSGGESSSEDAKPLHLLQQHQQPQHLNQNDEQQQQDDAESCDHKQFVLPNELYKSLLASAVLGHNLGHRFGHHDQLKSELRAALRHQLKHAMPAFPRNLAAALRNSSVSPADQHHQDALHEVSVHPMINGDREMERFGYRLEYERCNKCSLSTRRERGCIGRLITAPTPTPCVLYCSRCN